MCVSGVCAHAGCTRQQSCVLWHCVDPHFLYLKLRLASPLVSQTKQVCLLPGIHLHASIRDSFNSRITMVRRVQGYPTVKGFVNGKPAGDYNGERTAGAIKDWALSLVPNHITTLNRQPQVRMLRASHDSSGSSRAAAVSHWGEQLMRHQLS